MIDSPENSSSSDNLDDTAASGLEEVKTNEDSQSNDGKVSPGASAKGDDVDEVTSTNDASAKLGLIPEDGPASWLTHDLVLVHGICETKWTTEKQQPLRTKDSSQWLRTAGFADCRFLHFYYDIEGDENLDPPLSYRDGAEKEALKLLDDLLELRKEFNEEIRPAVPRPIMFIAHDLGGIIVKKALTIATFNPAIYGDIPYLTSVLIFLGCPHRGRPHSIEDQLSRLLLLPNPSYCEDLTVKLKNLTQTVVEVNSEFLDTKMLIRASVFNVYNEGVEKMSGDKGDESNEARAAKKEEDNKDAKILPAPFEDDTTTFHSPFEFYYRCTIPHLDLVLGEVNDSGLGTRIRESLDKFPYYTNINEVIAPSHRLLLSQAPPFIPVQQTELSWQPYLVEEWVVKTAAYEEWEAAHGLNVLHIHGSSEMVLKSQEVFRHLQGQLILRNILYFEFKRHDSRFNNLLAMLASFIAQIVSRCQVGDIIKIAFEMLTAHRAWTFHDLLQLFEVLQDSDEMKPMVYMIACVDQCNESQSALLEQLLSLREITEKGQKFIITSGTDESLRDKLSPWPAVNMDEFPTEGKKIWTATFDSTYSFLLRHLFDAKPIFAKFEATVRDILHECGLDYRLGHLVLRWFIDAKQKTTKAGIQKTLESLSPITPKSVLETILSSFDIKDQTRAHSLLLWVKCAFQPLTIWELGIALKLADEFGEDDLEDIDYDELRENLRQFGRVLWSNGNEVDFWYPSYAESREDFKGMDSPHGQIAQLCLRYLSFPSVQEQVKEFCHCHTQLDQTLISPPRRDLISYAVRYWPLHYKLAGSKRPMKEAVEFFQDPDARNTWARAHYVLSNPVTRIHKSYMSPLPVISMSGLDDLVDDQITRVRLMATFETDCGLAIVEAARHGHATTVRLLLQTCSPTHEALRDAISAAASFGEGGALDGLVEYASKVEGFRWPSGVLGRVAWLGLAKTAKALVKWGVEVNPSDGLYNNSPLHLAVDARHTAVVKVLIRAKCDVNSRIGDGYTPLHLAAARGNPEIVKRLLDAGAEREAETTGLLTPLQLATTGAKQKALEVLLEAGADMNHGSDGDDDAQSWEAKPLVHAAMMGYTECGRLLLKYNADVKAVFGNRTALYHAAAKGHIKVCRLLLENGADPNENPAGFDLILLVAVEDENIDLVTLLLNMGARIEEEDSSDGWRNTALSRAAGTGNKELVELLLKRGADVNHCGKGSQFPLYVASYSSDPDMVNLLLDSGANVNKPLAESGWCPLHAAYDNLDKVRILLERGAEIDQLCNAGTVLYLAAKHNHPEVLKLLLEHDPKPNLEIQIKAEEEVDLYEDCMTALCIACYKGNVEIMRLLLEAGANPNHKTRDGRFPLEFCLDTEGKVEEVIQTLLEFRPDLTQADNAGNTVLHHVSWATPISVVKLLYTVGANISVSNKAGYTPLTNAISAGRQELAKYLLSKGADPNAYAPDLGTPLHFAATNGFYNIFEVLINAGADINRADASGYKETLLYSACAGYMTNARLDIIKYLVKEAKVDVNAKSDRDLVYPLLRSVFNHGSEIVRYLLDSGTDPDREDRQGRRAIHLAAFRNTNLISPLIEAGAEIAAETKLKMTPLHFAAAAGTNFNDEIDILLDANGSVDIPDVDGWTPLMWLAKGSSSVKLIHKFLEREASLWVRGKGVDREWSPLKASRYFGSGDEVYTLLVPKEKKRVLPNGEEEVWDDEFHISKLADYKLGMYCDSCLMSIVGIDYNCSSCNFHLCYKCYQSKDILHPEHDFEEIGPEYVATSPSPEQRSSVTGDEVGITPYAEHGFSSPELKSETESEVESEDNRHITLDTASEIDSDSI